MTKIWVRLYYACFNAMVMLIVYGVYSDASYMDTVYVDADSFYNHLIHINISKHERTSVEYPKKKNHFTKLVLLKRFHLYTRPDNGNYLNAPEYATRKSSVFY